MQNTGSNEVVDIDAVEGSQGNVDVKMEVDDQLTAVTTAQQLTVEVTDDSSRKTFRDVGTDAPEDLLSKVEGATKKCVFKISFFVQISNQTIRLGVI